MSSRSTEKSIREEIEEREKLTLSPMATLSASSKGRRIPEEKCPLRTDFQRDRDRIIHSKAFRRLKHKTQVFLSPTGDHYRTRLTHTLEVSQIARTIARSTKLNEDLVEAIALGHDLGHTPFGHAGESVLDELLEGGFKHAEQSLRVVDVVEPLNLTYEVRQGIRYHSKGRSDIFAVSEEITWEAVVVRISDVIAYVNHDLDDAIRAGVLEVKDIPKRILRTLGDSHRKRIDTLVKGVVYYTVENGRVGLSDELHEALLELRDFLYERLYFSPIIKSEFNKARRVLRDLFLYFTDNPSIFVEKYLKKELYDTLERCVADFISGMTDRYAMRVYEEIFMPKPLF